MKGFPLQNKRMQRCALPFMKIGTCEVMNATNHYCLNSFHAFNVKNREFVKGNNKEHPAGMGDLVGAGLLDSYTGQEATQFVASYLSRAISLHTRVPKEIRALQKEFPDDPVVDVMSCALRRHYTIQGPQSKASVPLIDAWDMEQYAVCTDAALLQHVSHVGARQKNRSTNNSSDHEPSLDDGCRGVWFTAAHMPKDAADGPPSYVDVCVSCVGSSRAFGLARNAASPQKKERRQSISRMTSESIVPLSMDHHPLREEEYRRIIAAGGTIHEQGNTIDGNPFYSVSRSFGHFAMKNNPRRSPSEQKIISIPTTNHWRMLKGDVLVLCNHAVFESRHHQDTAVDEIAQLVASEVNQQKEPETVAAAVCDFAMRYGALHSLQVTVAVATDPTTDMQAGYSNAVAAGTHGTDPIFSEWVEPGPIHVELCRQHRPFLDALVRDCERCKISLEDLLYLRWLRIREVLPQRHKLPLSDLYGYQCGSLQQCMDEEAELFDGALTETLVKTRMLPTKEEAMPFFSSLARGLLSGGRLANQSERLPMLSVSPLACPFTGIRRMDQPLFGTASLLKGPSLSYYRALVHIFSYASQHGKDATDIIQDGIRGGVIQAFRRDTNSAVSANCSGNDNGAASDLKDIQWMPSSSFISAVATAVAQGFFCPSLPFTAEGGASSFNFRSEAFPRDAFTVIVLLFSDCFTDSQHIICNHQVEESQPDETSQRSSSPLIKSDTPHRHDSNETRPTASYSPGSVLACSTIQRLHISESDWKALQEVREEVAVSFLSSLHRSMYQIQMHHIEKRSAEATAAGNANKKNETPTERRPHSDPGNAVLDTLTSELERLKALLLLCICCASVGSEVTAAGNQLEKAPFTTDGLFMTISKGQFHTAFDHQKRCERQVEQDAWFDALVKDITKAYEAAHRGDKGPPPTLDALLQRIWSRSREAAQKLCASPQLVLHRPHDGHPGSSIELNRVCPMPALPHMPIQTGETIFMLSQSALALDCAATPLSTFLQRCAARKLSPADARAECAFLQERSWKDLSIKEHAIFHGFVSNPDNASKILDKNPEILAQIVLWTIATRDDTTKKFDFADSVIHQILFEVPFSVSVGKFARELVQQGYLHEDIVLQWLEHCCQVSETSPSQFSRSFFALVDFTVTRQMKRFNFFFCKQCFHSATPTLTRSIWHGTGRPSDA
eukprot:gene5023-3618_t